MATCPVGQRAVIREFGTRLREAGQSDLEAPSPRVRKLKQRVGENVEDLLASRGPDASCTPRVDPDARESAPDQFVRFQAVGATYTCDRRRTGKATLRRE